MLSTPPAFILSQDQTLKLKCLTRLQKFAWQSVDFVNANYPRFCLCVFHFGKSEFQRNFRILMHSKCIFQKFIYFEFSGLFHCSIIKVLCCCPLKRQRRLVYQMQSYLSTLFFIFWHFFEAHDAYTFSGQYPVRLNRFDFVKKIPPRWRWWSTEKEGFEPSRRY